MRTEEMVWWEWDLELKRRSFFQVPPGRRLTGSPGRSVHRVFDGSEEAIVVSGSVRELASSAFGLLGRVTFQRLTNDTAGRNCGWPRSVPVSPGRDCEGSCPDIVVL